MAEGNEVSNIGTAMPSAPRNHPPSLGERLLDLPRKHAQVDRPEQFLLNVSDALARLLGAEVRLHWSDSVDEAPTPPDAPHALRLHVTQQAAPFAFLDVTSGTPLEPFTRFALEHLAQDLTFRVDALTLWQMRKAVNDLREVLHMDPDLQATSFSALNISSARLGAEAGILFLRRKGAFEPLAVLGDWHTEFATEGLLDRMCTTGISATGPLHHDGGYVTAPIASTRPARCVILLRFEAEKEPHSPNFPVLSEMASVAAPYVDARWRDEVLHQLLELNRASEDTSSRELYRSVLQTALQLVPGADSGTLLTRTSPTEPFQYQAAEGFDLEALRRQPLTESQARTWYGADDEGWLQGVPRIFDREQVDITQLGASTTPDVDPQVTNYHLIRSTLCLPVLRDGHVMAVLDLDNLSQEHGLGHDSLQLAHLFGAPLASLLHRQQTHELLRRAAFTDDLTGLDNRRAFDLALERELARAKRGGPGPTVLLMDLKRFKPINDRFGHDVGDRVLAQVASAVRGALREVDYAARRGGDEFVALLVDTPAAAAEQVKERVAKAVAGVDGGLGPMVINIGAASYDTDGADPALLMRLADERMYREKQQ